MSASLPSRRALRARRAPARTQRGLGIIEVLVALVVVSLGVLGIAGMQLTGMHHSTGSLNRAKALMFAEDMAERMRVNTEDGVANAAYDGFDSDADAGLCTAAPAPYCDAADGTPPGDCGAEVLARFDLAVVSCGTWANEIATGGVVDRTLADGTPAGTLPGGRLAIDCIDASCGAGSTWTVTVGWTEGGTASEADVEERRRVTMRLRP